VNQENTGRWTVVFTRDEQEIERTFVEQYDALRFIAAGEDLGSLKATEIKAPNGYVMDRAGIEAALARTGLDKDWRVKRS
jgi:hypothetical protein